MSKLTMYLMGTAFVSGGLMMTLYKLSILNIWTGIIVFIIVGVGVKIAWMQPRQKENTDIRK